MKKTLAVIVEEKTDENGELYGNVVDCAYTMEEAEDLVKELFPDGKPYRIYYREWEDDENDS